MNNARCYFAALLAIAAVGCDYDKYEIELTPRGHQIERKLSTWTATENNGKKQIADDKLARLTELYGKSRSQRNSAVQEFSDTFKGQMPQDLHNAGWYLRYDSKMGYTCIYSERFGGQDDQAGIIQKRFDAADKLVDHLIKWFEVELAGKEGFDKLRNFMDTDFRRDVKNMASYMWMAQVLEKHDAPDEGQGIAFRVAHYLAERGYFSPQELPVVSRALGHLTWFEPGDKMLEFIQRLVAGKMNIAKGQPIPDSLAFLSNETATKQSLDAYLVTTPEYKKQLAGWQAEKKENRSADKPNPADVLTEELLSETLGFDMRWGDSKVDLKLTTDSKPWMTNSVYDPAAGKIRWSVEVSEGDHIPPICYAVWSVPDEAFQRKLFGKVVFDEDRLMEYCVWRNSLSTKEAKEWTDFLKKGFRPSPKSMERLEKFRFSDEPPWSPKDKDNGIQSYARHVLAQIRDALEGNPSTQPTTQPAGK